MTTATPIAPPACPPWCTADHASDLGRDQGEWAHTATPHEVRNEGDLRRVQAVYVETPGRAPKVRADFGVFVDANQDECLSPDEARELARAILSAADMIEGAGR
ncbi:MAG: hypothetical protein KDB60_07530 [Propionibacteriaceae bacterium]|nr:hypothetical protein [Propionibacteriaceae bacterium]